MLFSVIIPVYNAEKTLRRCLDSLVSQAEGRAELILVNDGSTDASDEICREYRDRYSGIRYLVQENSGVSAARNAGIELARGTFITFVDSDDYVKDDYFDVLQTRPELEFLAFSAAEERDGIQSGAKIGIRYDTTAENEPEYEDFVKAFLQTRNGSPWNKRFCRAILREKDISFPLDLSVGEDFVFCLQYLMAVRSVGAIEDCLYVVDESNGESLSRRYDPNSSAQALLIYRYSFDAVLQSTLDSAQKDSLLQILDYNYYRTGFACVKGLLRADLTRAQRLHRTREILSAFASDDRRIPPRNLIHRLSKFVVEKKLAHVAYAIARIHDRL